MSKEELLWKRFVKGDNDALGELYSELFEPLVFVSFYLVKDNDVARDIVGDLFVFLLSVQVKDRETRWFEINTVQAYLKVAVRNRSVDYVRKKQLKLSKALEMDQKLISEDSPFFAEILTHLKAEEKELFQLHLDGYNNEEIAQRKQLTEKTVRNKLSLTRKRMRIYLKSLLLFFA